LLLQNLKVETNNTQECRILLDQYFNNYSITPFVAGATNAGLYNIRTGDNKSFILKKQSSGLKNDYLNYKWLEGKLPVPEVIFYEQFNAYELLCMTELRGQTLEKYIGITDEKALVISYATALKLLHALPVDTGALVRDLDERMTIAAYNLENNLVDTGELEPENQEYPLRELFIKLLNARPTDFELVFTHGDYCLDNIVYDNGILKGFIDIGNGGIADRYQDIALAVRSIKDVFGNKPVNLFYEVYGLKEVNQEKLDFYTLLDEFL
jgi:aminoglycoside phosphotransferase